MFCCTCTLTDTIKTIRPSNHADSCEIKIQSNNLALQMNKVIWFRIRKIWSNYEQSTFDLESKCTNEYFNALEKRPPHWLDYIKICKSISCDNVIFRWQTFVLCCWQRLPFLCKYNNFKDTKGKRVLEFLTLIIWVSKYSTAKNCVLQLCRCIATNQNFPP